MKQTIILLVTLVFLLSILNTVVFNNLPEKGRQEQITEVARHIHQIDDVSFGSLDNDDLKMLDTLLSRKRIVILGESTHQDGTTFEAKSRLIKYLHENLGFNVVLYEAGQYDCWLMNEEMKLTTRNTPKDAVGGRGLYDFWWNNEENKPLIEYYIKSKSSSSPIEIGGFDIQLSGSLITGKERAVWLADFLSNNQINIENYPILNKNLNSLSFLVYDWYVKKHLDPPRQAQLLDELEKLGKAVSDLQKTDAVIIFSRYINDMKNNLSRSWKHKAGSMSSMHIRDSLMAGNLIHQIDSVYPNQKIIVWCANIHTFSSRYNATYLPLGAYIKNTYANNAYMIAFSSFGRYNSQNQVADKPSKYAVEHIFHAMEIPYFFLNLTQVPEQSFLKNEFVSTINQGISQKRRWSSYVDGIFYIDVNKNPTYKN